MNRREYLAAVGTVSTVTALAGCGGAEEGEDFELLDHDFSASTGGIDFEATVENTSDEEQDISIDVELYQGNTLLDNATAFFTDLPSGTQSTETGFLADISNVDDVERYVLKNSSGVDDAVELEENDGDQFREKLEASE